MYYVLFCFYLSNVLKLQSWYFQHWKQLMNWIINCEKYGHNKEYYVVCIQKLKGNAFEIVTRQTLKNAIQYLLSMKELFLSAITKPSEVFLSLCLFFSSCFHAVNGKQLEPTQILWQYRLRSFQGKDTKVERFLTTNQLQSNEIIEF